jgi:hypothetical protein
MTCDGERKVVKLLHFSGKILAAALSRTRRRRERGRLVQDSELKKNLSTTVKYRKAKRGPCLVRFFTFSNRRERENNNFQGLGHRGI